MLKIDNLHAYYGKSHVLHGVSFDVQPGEIVALLGRNGSGRSTTAKAIMGMVDWEGSINWKGQELRGKKAYEIAHLGLGYVPESRDVFPNLTVHQNLMLGQKGNGKNSRWSFDDMYQMFPRLKERQHTEAGVMSGGEQQMLTLCRTLMGERIWWLALPVVVYGGIAAALFIPDNSPLFDCFVNLGEGFITGNILSFIGVLAAIALMWFINRTLMQKLIYNELNKVEDTRIKHVSEYKFLDRYGEIGEYMRLELKLLLRNKICKRSLYSITGVVIMFSSIISFSDVYDGGLRDFFVLYNYIIFGIMFLSTLMGYEGNYIDGLMSRKESIYSLLRAKYILYSIALLIPTILMIPGMVTGKVSVLGCIAWLIFIPGAVYCCLFQLAVYNNKTTDLNSKMTSRQNIGTGLQNLISGGAFGIPLLLLFALNAIFGKEVTPWILIGIGVAFIATSKFWLMNVYHRLMKRRYKNMEGFRDSRQK